jgi:Trp operon repressor
MTNVSKKPLDDKLRKQLFEQFSSLFASSSQHKMASLFIELFTEAEQIMFIKRVGIILMLTKGYSGYAISNMLEVSAATVRSTKQKYEAGEYDQLFKTTKKRSFDGKKFWSVLGLVITGGLPPRAGAGRWSFIFNE